MPEYLRVLLHGLTQILGGFFGVTINANETTSAWAYRVRHLHPFPYKAINALFFWQADHCKSSVEREVISCIELLEIHGYTVNLRGPQ